VNSDSKWYVVDHFGEGVKAILLGPFATKALSEQARRRINIADDCISLKLVVAKVNAAREKTP